MDQIPMSPILWAQQQLGKSGPTGATRIIVVPALAAVIPAVVGAVAQNPLITWRDPGTVIALYGQERSGTPAKFAQTEVSVQFSGDEFLVTNGSAQDYAPLLALVGPNVNWYSMLRRVARGDVWAVSWRNMDPTPATADPTALFGFIADADLGRLQDEYDTAMALARAGG